MIHCAIVADALDKTMGSTEVRLEGTIIKRRSMGRNLAFAEVLSNTKNDTFEVDAVVSVAFRRDSFLGTNFPVKNSHLSYGALVDMSIQKSERTSGPPWKVLTWTIVQEDAKELATNSDGGMCCSKYLQIRSEKYLEIAAYHTKPSDLRKEDTAEPFATPSKDHSQAKSLRSKIFASWLLENLLCDEDRVLDVAGGKGELSMQLALLGGVACTVVDPVVRKRPKMKQLVKLSKPVPNFRSHAFTAEDAKTIEAVDSHSCLVGLHPDEPTEDIVDLAIERNKSFAVVPCCVFPSFNPQRRLASGKFVQTYEQFLEYLMQKDSRIERTTLHLEGKNHVVYLKVVVDTKTMQQCESV